MVRFSADAEMTSEVKPGEYLFKIYEVNEKVSKAGNDYWQVKFESKEGVKVCDTFLFSGKAAAKTLGLFAALGLSDGENFPKDDFTPDDILGQFVYINTVKDKDSEFLKCPWNKSGYRAYTGKAKAKPVKQEEETESPF